MTVLCNKRPQLWTREVPGGWRIVNIRQGGSITPYYLSPEGRRFASLQAVRAHVATLKVKSIEAEDEAAPDTETSTHKRKRKRKRKASCSGSVAKRLRLEDEEDVEPRDSEPASLLDLSIPPEIQKRRKLMAMRSPFRNLLKRTLVRNHIRMKGRMTMMISKAEIVTRSKPSETEEKNSPPSKRLKLDTSPLPPRQDEDSSHSKDERESKDQENLFSTPPRKMKREMQIFTPPNLTPPVARRPRTVSFSQPNQRNVTSRNVQVKHFNIKNANLTTQ